MNQSMLGGFISKNSSSKAARLVDSNDARGARRRAACGFPTSS
jgi:acetyl-CoA carboxylase carboxyltransferase component